MDTRDNKIAKDIQALFEQVRTSEVDLDPFLETRTLATWRERRRLGATRFWKWFALGASTLSLGLVAVLSLTFSRGNYPEAFVGEPFAVRVQVKDLERFAIVKAQIILPNGVSFEMDQIPGLQDPRQVTLVWNNQGQTHLLPFLLKSTETGVKTVVVRFLDQGDKIVAEKKLMIRLKNTGDLGGRKV